MRTNLIWNPFVEVSVTGETRPHVGTVTVIVVGFRGDTGDRVTICFEAENALGALRDITSKVELGVRVANAIERPDSDPGLSAYIDEAGRFEQLDDISGLYPEDGESR